MFVCEKGAERHVSYSPTTSATSQAEWVMKVEAAVSRDQGVPCQHTF